MKIVAKSRQTRRSSRRTIRTGHAVNLGQRNGGRIELGEYVVADPLICHGKPTFKGTRIMVWQILEALAHGESVEQLVKAWGGRVSKAAILETIPCTLSRAAFTLNRPFPQQ